MTTIIGGIIAITLFIPNAVLSIQSDTHNETSTAKKIEISSDSDDPSPTKLSSERNEILWLARAIYSETKDEKEMELIAWVIRNRVENHYWGDCTYEEVVNRPKQFSGLNNSDSQYKYNINLTHKDINTSWQTALVISKKVYHSSDEERPFSKEVQHFYSPEIIKTPQWAENEKLAFVSHDKNNGKIRFAFYKNVK